MDPMEYSPKGKGIMTPMEYTPMVSSTKVKARFYERLFFEVITIMVKDKKHNIKCQSKLVLCIS